MFEVDRALWEHYGRLKRLEKLFELNISVLEELRHILSDNLEEFEEFLEFLDGDERIIGEKIRASLKTILKHLDQLKERTERDWETVEITILHLFVKKEPSDADRVVEVCLKDFYRKLDTLKDYLRIHHELFDEEMQKYAVFKKFPADLYVRFLEKLAEFNEEFWR